MMLLWFKIDHIFADSAVVDWLDLAHLNLLIVFRTALS